MAYTLAMLGGQVTAWRAGHVLGAAMFMVEIAGMRALYTGDYSRLADRHMSAADLPSPPPHIGGQAIVLLCCRVFCTSLRLPYFLTHPEHANSTKGRLTLIQVSKAPRNLQAPNDVVPAVQ